MKLEVLPPPGIRVLGWWGGGGCAWRALRLRYLDGKSWSECARRMGYADESGPRKLVGKLWLK